MSNDINDDLYEDEEAPYERDPKPAKSAPTKSENIAAVVQGPKTGKVIAVTVGAVAIVGGLVAVSLNGRSAVQAPQLPTSVQGANVGSPPALTETPNTALANSDQYNSMVDHVNRERAESAKAQGISSQPLAEATLRSLTPTADGSQQMPSPGQVPPPQLQGGGPLPGAPTMPQPGVQSGYQQVAYQQQQYQQPGYQDPQIQAQMQRAQDAIRELTTSRPRSMQTFQFAEQSQAGQGAGQNITAGAVVQAGGGQGAVAGQAPSGSPSPQAQSYTLLRAGTVESVKLITGINTDSGSDFVAELVTGPLAGSRLVGSYKRDNELASLQFRSLSLPSQMGAATIPIQASGLDAYSSEPGTATSVDRKTFTKYALKPLAAGLAAVGDAIKQGGTTVIVNGTSTVSQTEPISSKKAGQIAVGAAAQQLSTDANALDTTPTVRVAKDTILGVQFIADVIYTPKGN